ncbi:MAG: glycine cleavage T C-terminal barrel domain-containing protein [Dehalococcoidia bacterium]
MDDLLRSLRPLPGLEGGPLGTASTRVLPLAGMHIELGCHPAPAHGYTMPLWYTGALDEQVATREGAGLFDRSHLARFAVTGERAAQVLASVLATDATRIPLGAVRRAVACHEDGSIIDVPTLWHLDEGRWLVTTTPEAGDHLASHLEEAAAGEDVVLTDRESMTALLSLQGPRAHEIASEVLGPALVDSVERDRCRELLLGVHRAALARTSSVGEDGYLLLLNPDDGADIWHGLVEAGATSAGITAHDALRLEAAVIEAPAETPRPATPFAAGLEALVDLDGADGPRAFPGAQALRDAGPPERRLTGLVLDGPRLAHRGSRVTSDVADVGACVAAGFSPALEAGIALAYLPTSLDGSSVLEVDTDGVPQRARIEPLPFVAPR